MTRRSDLMCEDLFGCDHTPETPIIDDYGEILYSVCRCGRRHYPEPENAVRPEPPKPEPGEAK